MTKFGVYFIFDLRKLFSYAPKGFIQNAESRCKNSTSCMIPLRRHLPDSSSRQSFSRLDEDCYNTASPLVRHDNVYDCVGDNAVHWRLDDGDDQCREHTRSLIYHLVCIFLGLSRSPRHLLCSPYRHSSMASLCSFLCRVSRLISRCWSRQRLRL